MLICCNLMIIGADGESGMVSHHERCFGTVCAVALIVTKCASPNHKSCNTPIQHGTQRWLHQLQDIDMADKHFITLLGVQADLPRQRV